MTKCIRHTLATPYFTARGLPPRSVGMLGVGRRPFGVRHAYAIAKAWRPAYRWDAGVAVGFDRGFALIPGPSPRGEKGAGLQVA